MKWYLGFLEEIIRVELRFGFYNFKVSKFIVANIIFFLSSKQNMQI